MYLKKLSLLNFKNFESQTFEFHDKINCFVGNNGVGKTNVLDAIYYLSFGKSYFNSVASQNIRHHQDFFMIEGSYNVKDRNESIVCSLKRGAKKVIKRNDKEYERFSDHIGQIPLVIISPADRDLITEGSDIRRKFIDSVISQSDTSYLKSLINYNKVLQQRNALLKYFAANRTFDIINLQVYNEQLEQHGTVIYNKRKAFLEIFTPIFEERYDVITNGKEKVTLAYKTQLEQGSLTDLLDAGLEKDRMLQYTNIGIHKDDLIFNIDEFPVKKFGSQGQQKSFLIALKLAQFEFIKNLVQKSPILLLDDIFDKLDDERVAQIVGMVNQDNFGQLFISDTHKKRTEEVVKRTNQTYQIFNL
jgi:DNA replication and repair protein RecF